MIIIAGDSWGCGEWNNNVNKTTLHNGLAQYLTDSGHQVLNMSTGGACQQSIIAQLQIAKKLALVPLHQTKIFIFQTEWYRHLLPMLEPKSGWSFTFSRHFVDYQISYWLHSVSRFATDNQVRIGIIGGQIDTIWLDQFEIEYPNLYIVCQSFVNLCVHDTDRIDNPVKALNIEEGQFERFKQTCESLHDLEFVVELIDQANSRRELMQKHPTWFMPDGCHGNRLAHKKLYEFINDKKYI